MSVVMSAVRTHTILYSNTTRAMVILACVCSDTVFLNSEETNITETRNKFVEEKITKY